MTESLDLSLLEPEVQKAGQSIARITAAIRQVLVGQENVAERLIMALIAEGHVLLEGLPGLAKTTAVKALGDASGLRVARIQFTPDMLPADVIGTEIYSPKTGEFQIKKGPVFANLVIADEINRAPAKVQSALLEAMQERQVTIGDQTFKLDQPFLVMATQNPVEQEGTYPLPEAQVDRFLFKVKVGYGSLEDEIEVARRINTAYEMAVEAVSNREEILGIRDLVSKIHFSDKLRRYGVEIVFATRDPKAYGISGLEGMIEIGASPRASINLEKAAKVKALMEGRAFVIPQDIKDVALDTLRHRVMLSYEAEADNKSSDDLIEAILSGVDVP